MDNRTAKIINCLSNRVKKLESQNSNETRLNLKDFTNKKFDENKIEEALNELRVYFKKQNRLLCLIGNDETLLSDTNFNHLLSEVKSVEGNFKHYSKEDNVINNHYSDIDEDMKKNIDMVNELTILLEVGNKMTPQGVGSLRLLDARYLEEIGYGLKLYSGNSYVMAYGNDKQNAIIYMTETGYLKARNNAVVGHVYIMDMPLKPGEYIGKDIKNY